MRYIILTTLVAFAARCTAQGAFATLDNLPSCAKPCANTLPAQCNLGVQCICSDQAFITSISCCIATSCSQSDQQQTLQVAQQLCDTVNVKLPSAAACSGSSSVASSTNAATSASSATSAATGTATGTASSAVSQASTSGTSATSSGGATAGSATGSTKSTTSSSTTAATGAAERLGSHMGAVGAAVAALALL